MHEISSGRVVAEDGMERASVQWEDFIINTSFLVIGGLILGVIGVFVVQGLILNALHKRMYASTTALAYLPITNTYITVKMAFGPRIAMVFIIAYLISVPLSFLGIFILSVFLSFVPGFAFILDIIKLFSQKYDLCYLEPFEYNSNVATGGKFTLNQDSTPVVNTPPQETIPAPTDHVEADPSGDKVLDLNYSTNEPVQPVGDLEESNEDGFSYEDVSGKSPEPSDENEENSDLMNLFK
ncbi:MAG: hypothetical protein J6X28_04835 [Bacilli bacterium]|nr:hypothetical protein [Bacilli bacterium]